MMKMNIDKPPLQLTDTVKAAAILAAGGKLVGLRRISHRTVGFVLEPEDQCRKFASDFDEGSLMVNAKLMAESLKLLKDAIFADLNRNPNLYGSNQSIYPINK